MSAHLSSAQQLYQLATRLHPHGIGGDEFIPIVINEQALELRYFTERGRGDDAQFCIFVPERRYARRSIIVYANGVTLADDEGTIPESDRLVVEPQLPHGPELIRILLETLQAVDPH